MTEEEQAVATPEYAVEMNNVNKRFGEVTAIKNLTLDVPKGSIFGFIGPSGCGKTTTIRLMLGTYRADEGTIKVMDKSPNHFKRHDQKQIGYMPQLFILYPELTVLENLNFAASIYGFPYGHRKERFAELLDLVELTGHEKKQARNISGGMQRRLSLAATLIHDPTLIFLDEPTAGIDPVLRRKFWDHFHNLRDDGHTLFVTTQYVGEAAYCDYVGVMRSGELLMVETPEDLRYRALGGHLIDLHAPTPLPHDVVDEIINLDFMTGPLNYLNPMQVQLTVDDASVAIPQLLHWCEERDLEIDSINENVPPFDDIFVRIMEMEDAKEAAQNEAEVVS